jgi:hypothetical protein
MKQRRLQRKLSERGRANLQIMAKERDVLKRLAALENTSMGELAGRLIMAEAVRQANWIALSDACVASDTVTPILPLVPVAPDSERQ